MKGSSREVHNPPSRSGISGRSGGGENFEADGASAFRDPLSIKQTCEAFLPDETLRSTTIPNSRPLGMFSVTPFEINSKNNL